MPYFSIPVEQLEADEGYMFMNGTDKGLFLRLLLILWRNNGLLPDYSKMVAQQLGVTEQEWQRLRGLFIERGLLSVSTDRVYLLSQELRQQYINTLIANNARRNNKLQS
jgi:hypothetical protein